MNSKVTRSEIVAAGQDAESSGTSDDEKAKKSGNSFVNPLAKPKKIIDMDGDMSEGDWSSDNASDGNKDDKKKKKDKKLGKRKRGADDDEEDAVKNFF